MLKVIGIPDKKLSRVRGNGCVGASRWEVFATLGRKVMMGIIEKLTFKQRLERGGRGTMCISDGRVTQGENNQYKDAKLM